MTIIVFQSQTKKMRSRILYNCENTLSEFVLEISTHLKNQMYVHPVSCHCPVNPNGAVDSDVVA